MKKLLSLVMVLICTISIATVGFSQTAFAKTTKGVTKYKISKVDKSKKYKNGMTAQIYYKKVVLKGSSKSIKKINKVLSKDCNNFFKSADTKRMYNYVKNSTPPSKYDPKTLIHRATSKVKYNKNNIISISVTNYWFGGNAIYTTLKGYTYNVKTGKKLTLTNVCNRSKKKIRSEIAKKLDKQYGNGFSSKCKSELKNVNKLPFYITKNNKCVVGFVPDVPSFRKYITITLKSRYK